MRLNVRVIGIKTILAILALGAAPVWAENFTTAGEVRPILTATRGNWVALREYDGQDLIYFTQIESWRCGLTGVRFSVNGQADQNWPLETCYEGEPAPNAIKGTNGLPYAAVPLNSIQTLSVTVIYDDGSADSSKYERASILMP